MRKYVTQFVALERNAEKGIPGHMADAYRAYRAGRLEEFYAPLVVGERELARRVELGELAIDTRLRDRLAALGFGDAGTTRPLPRRRRASRRPPPGRASTRRSRSRISASPTAGGSTRFERRLSALGGRR